jgi:hypothetical protein
MSASKSQNMDGMMSKMPQSEMVVMGVYAYHDCSIVKDVA